MTKQGFLKKMASLADDGGWGTQNFFDPNDDGGCPCFCGSIKIDGKMLYVNGKCWRVSDNDQDLYVWGEFTKKELREYAESIKKALDAQEWYNPYTIIYEESK
jgi:hypothetical protein